VDLTEKTLKPQIHATCK